MTLIQVDGHYVEPTPFSAVSFGAFTVGDRLTFLLKTKESPSSKDYEVMARSYLAFVAGPPTTGPTMARAMLRYTDAPGNAVSTVDRVNFPPPPDSPPDFTVLFDEWTQVRADTTKGNYHIPARAHYHINLNNTLAIKQTGFEWSLVGGKPFEMPRGKPFIAGNREGTPYFQLPRAVIDVVIHSVFLAHPIHFHQFAGYLLASGTGEFPGYETAAQMFNLKNPPKHDTFTVPAELPPDPASKGWAVVRIVADTPGPWLVHCHVVQHQRQGMAAILNVEGLPSPRNDDFPLCGDFAPAVDDDGDVDSSSIDLLFDSYSGSSTDDDDGELDSALPYRASNRDMPPEIHAKNA